MKNWEILECESKCLCSFKPSDYNYGIFYRCPLIIIAFVLCVSCESNKKLEKKNFEGDKEIKRNDLLHKDSVVTVNAISDSLKTNLCALYQNINDATLEYVSNN